MLLIVNSDDIRVHLLLHARSILEIITFPFDVIFGEHSRQQHFLILIQSCKNDNTAVYVTTLVCLDGINEIFLFARLCTFYQHSTH